MSKLYYLGATAHDNYKIEDLKKKYDSITIVSLDKEFNATVAPLFLHDKAVNCLEMCSLRFIKSIAMAGVVFSFADDVIIGGEELADYEDWYRQELISKIHDLYSLAIAKA